ncbi:MAG: DUF192 domain-containing protein [Bdellovibrionales bacterium]|nr:DUF192 domain-containing protein [Bdellovibrionales bacterium]
MTTNQLLLNQSKQKNILSHLTVAKDFVARTRGLLGLKELKAQHGMWIHACPSIHTFFMKFPIDVVFVDEKLVVKSVHQNVRPWRIVVGAFGSSSVFEMPAGTLSKDLIETGDQLHVGH